MDKRYSHKYGFGKAVAGSFDLVISKVTDALQKEGFGILSDIDVAATLKKKLNIESSPYRILGACNPILAHRALQVEPSIGLLLPCNIIVRMDNKNNVHVEIMEPVIIATIVNIPQINELAIDAKEKLERVLNEL